MVLNKNGLLRTIPPPRLPSHPPLLSQESSAHVLCAPCSEITLSCGYGNAANSYRGPGIINFDMGLTRRFQITEGQSVEFRAEAFNMPNHVNPLNPTNSMRSQTFGKSTEAADPRIMQFALKYVF